MEKAKTRNFLFDNIKFILITLVVVGHFIDFYIAQSDIFKSMFLFIYSFHMPLFIFISGLFHKNKDIGKKVIFLVSCGFCSKIFLTLCSKFLRNGNLKFVLLSDGGLPWYMFVLAMFVLAGYLLRNQNKVFLFFASIVLAMFVGLDKTVGDYLYLSRFVVLFPYYILGNMLNSEKIVEFKQKYKWLIIPSILVLVGWACICCLKIDDIYNLRYLFTAKNPFLNDLPPTGPIVRLICYLITFAVSVAIIFTVPSKKMPFISNAGKNTLNVYFYHFDFVAMLFTVDAIKNLVNFGPLGKIVIVLIAIAVSVILSLNIFSFPLKQIRKFVYKGNQQT
ncbi:MAG: acyltransferase family protein [Oscillospiraceae bacterium]|nr:acyltransferase family protein [Oscillospiraceae bacterium]